MSAVPETIQASSETSGSLSDVKGEIEQRSAVARVFADQYRLHQGRELAPICRFYVRF